MGTGAAQSAALAAALCHPLSLSGLAETAWPDRRGSDAAAVDRRQCLLGSRASGVIGTALRNRSPGRVATVPVPDTRRRAHRSSGHRVLTRTFRNADQYRADAARPVPQAQRRPEASQCVRGNVPPCGGNCQPVSCCRAAASRHCCICGVLGYCDRSWAVSLWLRARFNSGQPWAATRPSSPPNKARAAGMGEARGTSGAAAFQRQTKIAAE